MAGLQLKIDPSGIVIGGAVAESALEKVQREAVQTETALASTGKKGAASLNDVAAAGTKMQRSFGGNGLRMASMQLSQVAQQGAVTGNYLQALIIQAPDLALGFGVVGIAIGALIPVLYGVGKAFLGAGDSAESALEQTSNLLDDINSIKSEFAALTNIANDYAQAVALGQTTIASALSEEIEIRGQLLQLRRIEIEQQQAAAQLAAQATADAIADIRDEVANAVDMIDQDIGNSEFVRTQGMSSAIDATRNLIDANKDVFLEQERQTLELSLAENLLRQIDDALAIATGGAGGLADNLAAGADEAARLVANMNSASRAGVSGPDAAVQQSRTAFGIADNEAGSRVGRLRGVVGQTSIRARAPTRSGGRGGASAAASRAREINATRTAYDSLRGSLDPLVAAELQLAGAQATVNDAMTSGFATAEQGAAVMALAQAEFDKAAKAASTSVGYWAELQDVGGSALDRLIDGTASLKDALSDMIKELVLAITKKNLLGSVSGATSDMSLGGIVMQSLFGGFMDSGGTLGMGKTAIVGERGPEAVTATTRGAVVTSRADTARQGGGGSSQQNVAVQVGVSVDDAGKIQAYVKSQTIQSAAQTYNAVKNSLPTWQGQMQTDGALS